MNGKPVALPPPLRRQNASRFMWPPDRSTAWCYISISPIEMVEQAERIAQRPVSLQEVKQVFTTPDAADAPAYVAYVQRWWPEFEGLVAEPTGGNTGR